MPAWWTAPNVYVVVYTGYELGEFSLKAAFRERAAADDFVRAETAEYISPDRYAREHYEVFEIPLA